MPRPASKEPKTRLNLDVPERVRQRMERLREASGSESLTEVIRRALAVYEVMLTSVTEQRAKVLLEFPDGTTRQLVVEP